MEPVGQQGHLVVELELVDEDAVQVTPLFFAERRVTGDSFDCRFQVGFVFRMPLLTVRANEGVTRMAKGMV